MFEHTEDTAVEFARQEVPELLDGMGFVQVVEVEGVVDRACEAGGWEGAGCNVMRAIGCGEEAMREVDHSGTMLTLIIASPSKADSGRALMLGEDGSCNNLSWISWNRTCCALFLMHKC